MHQDFGRRVEDVLFERDGFQVRLDATGLRLLGVSQWLNVAFERLEEHLGCSATVISSLSRCSLIRLPV